MLVSELNYTNLKIQEGGTANMVYSKIKYQNADTAKVQRAQLLAYCKLDILALVNIL